MHPRTLGEKGREREEAEEPVFSARPVKSMSKDGLLELATFSSCHSGKCSVHVVQARARDPPQSAMMAEQRRKYLDLRVWESGRTDAIIMNKNK